MPEQTHLAFIYLLGPITFSVITTLHFGLVDLTLNSLQENTEWNEWQATTLHDRNVVENVYRWACGYVLSYVFSMFIFMIIDSFLQIRIFVYLKQIFTRYFPKTSKTCILSIHNLIFASYMRVI